MVSNSKHAVFRQVELGVARKLMVFPCDRAESRRAACGQRASLRPVNIRSAGKSIGASAGLQRLPMAHAPPILPHAETSASSAVGQLGNRLDDLLEKRARTFCRYLHRGVPAHASGCVTKAE